MRSTKIADAVVRRLVIYLRALEQEPADDDATISSYELAERAGVNPALVRKDLAWFGEFGTRGVGYKLAFLRSQLRRILNLEHEVPAALVGAGSLGVALTRYSVGRRAADSAFNVRIVALFDNDPGKIGLSIDGVPVYSVRELAPRVRELGVDLGILCTPATAAQEVALTLAAAGVKGILNFAPVALRLPPGVRLVSADLSLEMQYVAYLLERERVASLRETRTAREPAGGS